MQRMIQTLTTTFAAATVPVIDVVGANRRRHKQRTRVLRAGQWVDISHRVASGTIRESNDAPVATLELRLLNGQEFDTLAPRRKDSPLNRVDDQYAPLLWIGNPIAVEAAFTTDGSEPDDWWPVFLGELEDDIDTESDGDGTYVRIGCRDFAMRLQRDYIMGPLVYENMYSSQIMQQLLNDRYASGNIPEPVTLTVIGPDDFFIERYEIEYMSTWDALQKIARQRGADLRYRLNESTGQIELTYWRPDRTMVPGWMIDASEIRREELRISGTDIINRVTVRYRDGAGERQEVTVEDQDSISLYRVRHGLLEEPDTDLVPDEATATTLAESILADLKDVPALTRIDLPFDPRMQLFDKLRVINPGVRDEAEDYAIEERELSFSAEDWSMSLVAGGTVVVKRNEWQERLAREGVKAPFTPRDTTTGTSPAAPTGLTGSFSGVNALFSWDASRDPYHKQDVVEVWVGGVIKRREYVSSNTYAYTLDMNRKDNGQPASPQVEVRVRHEYTTGARSAPAIIAVSHPAPTTPSVTARSSSAQIRWSVTSATPAGWENTLVEVGEYSETIRALTGALDAEEAELEDGQIATVSVRVRNVFGQQSDPGQAQTTVNYVDKAQFAADIKPVVLVSTLPQLPNPEYPQGAVVFLTTDNKLYRSTGTEWTAAVPAVDLDGEIEEGQIADQAVTAAKLAEKAVEESKLALDAVTEDILAADAVTETKIKDDAVTTPKLVANAVTAAKIAVGAVIAEKIKAGAITTEKLDAGAVTAGKIAAKAILAEHIEAGSVTTDKIDALAVTAAKLAANAVTADKLAANSVTAGKIAAGAVKADAIDVGELRSKHMAGQTLRITPESGEGPARIIVDDGTSDRVVTGNIGGKPWGDTVLPPNTYGTWGERAGMYLRGYPRIVKVGGINVALQTSVADSSRRDALLFRNILLSELDETEVQDGSVIKPVITLSEVRITDSVSPARMVMQGWEYVIKAFGDDKGFASHEFRGPDTYNHWSIDVAIDVRWFEGFIGSFGVDVVLHYMLFDVENT